MAYEHVFDYRIFMSEAPEADWRGDDPRRLAELDRDWPLVRHERPDPVEAMRATVRPLRPTVRARSRTYRAALPRESGGVVGGDHAAVLQRAANAHEVLLAAQVAELETAVDWAALHRDATHGDVADGGEQLVAIAGDGAPLVAEFCIPELALRLGVATDTARHLMADALELVHRLPACWAALWAGGIAAHKARRVAQATRDLNADAAAFVDREVAPYLHAIGARALDAVVERAVWAHDLDRAVAASQAALDRRGITVDLDARSTSTGTGATCEVWGDLDRADALELERAIADLAHHQLLAGSTDTLDVRRAKALGMLARRETPIPLPDLSPGAEERRAAHEEWDEDVQEPPSVVSRRRDLTLHVHLSLEAIRSGTGMARLEGSPQPISLDQVREWTQAPGTTTRITVRPVLDLDAHLETPGYTPAADLAEQTVLRDGGCVFPHCTRQARRCDLDHVVPHHEGGPTSSDNLAALCRRHHRLKTHHSGWTYRVLHPGTYLWTTPAGQRLLRDPGGTHPL